MKKGGALRSFLSWKSSRCFIDFVDSESLASESAKKNCKKKCKTPQAAFKSQKMFSLAHSKAFKRFVDSEDLRTQDGSSMIH